MTTEDLRTVLDTFETALARFQEVLALPKSEVVRDAAIQRFEFTVELAWKTVMRFARNEGYEVVSPRQAFRTALKMEWIEDDEVWMKMIDDRNLTSHTYSETLAEALFARFPAYSHALTQLRDHLHATIAPAE